MNKYFSITCDMHIHTIKVPGGQPIARSSSEYLSLQNILHSTRTPGVAAGLVFSTVPLTLPANALAGLLVGQ